MSVSAKWEQIRSILDRSHEYIILDDSSNNVFRRVARNEDVRFVLFKDGDVPAIFDSRVANWAHATDEGWTTLCSMQMINEILTIMRRIPEKNLRKKYINSVKFMQRALSNLKVVLTNEVTAAPFHAAFMHSCLIAHIIFNRPLPLKDGAIEITTGPNSPQ